MDIATRKVARMQLFGRGRAAERNCDGVKREARSGHVTVPPLRFYLYNYLFLLCDTIFTPRICPQSKLGNLHHGRGNRPTSRGYAPPFYDLVIEKLTNLQSEWSSTPPRR